MSEPSFESDVLSDALACLEIEDIGLSRTQVRGRGGISFPPGLTGAMVHVIEQGEVVLHNEDVGSVLLEAGTVALVPYANRHKMGAPGLNRFTEIGQARSERSEAGYKWVYLGEVGKVSTQVFSAYFTFRFREASPMLDAVLGCLWVGPGERTEALDAIVRLLMEEMRGPRPGLRLMSAHLVELLFVCLLRVHAERLDALKPGLLRGLGDARLARVLGEVSAAPERDWSLEAMSRVAGLSRSRLTALFKERVGMTLQEYVAHWRIVRAQRLLRGSDLGLLEVAERVGYGSDVALSRAFKRLTGVSPGAWRRQAM